MKTYRDYFFKDYSKEYFQKPEPSKTRFEPIPAYPCEEARIGNGPAWSIIK